MSKSIRAEINNILTRLNPIGFPPLYAEIEYTSYVEEIYNTYKKGNSIYDCLVNIYSNTMEYDMNKVAERDIHVVASEIIALIEIMEKTGIKY